tara:strand:- start:547 stop:1260 length:714 start_codon:yes stop_codon:yes gene_type:complete
MTEFLHRGDDKKKFVRGIFDDIADRYDFLNHLLSFGIDIYWRKKFIKLLSLNKNSKVLDVATGTGDLSIEILSAYPGSEIIGLDISPKMLAVAQRKIDKKKLNGYTLIEGDAENLPFEDSSFDCVTIAYGLRNLGSPKKGLEEFNRVLKDGGKLAVLEFMEPQSNFLKRVFGFYFNFILPKVGALFSNSKAYRYLPESVKNFMNNKELEKTLEEIGFIKVVSKNFSLGITSVFIFTK